MLLILAGISIVTLTGQNGVLTKAGTAKEEAKKAEYKEVLELIGNGLRPEKVIENLSAEDFIARYKSAIQEEIDKGGTLEGAKIIEKNPTTLRVITKEGYVYEITENGVKYLDQQGKNPPPDLQEADIDFNLEPNTYTNGNVTVEIIPKIDIKGFTLQYSRDGNKWDNYTTGEKILYTENGTILARLINPLDEEGGFATKTIDKIDRDAPGATASFSQTTTDIETAITATVTQTDKGTSDVNFKQCRWKYSTESGTVGNNPASYPSTGTFNKSPEVITLNATVPGTYYLHILTIDNAENPKETIEGPIIVKGLTVEKFKNKQTTFTVNTEIEDTYGNSITIPKGFKIASDSANDVTGGVVIEDVNYGTTAGSQFVWVPVGTIKGANGTTKRIDLDRYTFGSGGTPIKQGTNLISGLFEELYPTTRRNTAARDLTKFKTSVEAKYGYYIGRYEGTLVSGKLICKKGQTVTGNQYQPNSAQYARDMYGVKAEFSSDLVNSYAFDTALVYIQTCSGDTDYAVQTPPQIGNSFLQSGGTYTNGQSDLKCNIYDLSSNYGEWTTESSRDDSAWTEPCVNRGDGTYRQSGPATRTNAGIDSAGVFAIRPILYVY